MYYIYIYIYILIFKDTINNVHGKLYIKSNRYIS